MMILEKLNDLAVYKPTEKSIICYLIENLNSLDSLTISALAKGTYTSNATVVRFCQGLGFSGFRDFKIQLIKEINHQYQDISKVDANMPFSPGDNVYAISNKLAQLISNNIERTHQMLDPAALAKAVNYIDESRRLFIFAKGDSYVRAMIFKNRMIKIDRYVILADENHEASFSARNATPEDCVLFVTYSAHQYDYDSYIKIFRALRIRSIVLTANDKSQLVQQCDVVLRIPLDESFGSKVAGFASQISFEYVLDILYSAIFNKNYQINYNSKQIKESYTNRIISGKVE